MLLNLKLVVLSFLIVINSVDSESINCEAKFISKITKLCRHGISEESESFWRKRIKDNLLFLEVIHLLSKCCSAHCSKAHLKMFCTMKPHKFERHGNYKEWKECSCQPFLFIFQPFFFEMNFWESTLLQYHSLVSTQNWSLFQYQKRGCCSKQSLCYFSKLLTFFWHFCIFPP